MKACYATVKAGVESLFKKCNSLTKQECLVTLAADKDATRQVIVATYLDVGSTKEQMLTCSIAGCGNADATMSHFKNTIAEFFDYKQLAYVCTDSIIVHQFI